MAFSEHFPDSIPDLPDKLAKAEYNTSTTLADIYPDDLKLLIEKLEKRHIHLGKLVGSGSLGLVFEIKNSADKEAVAISNAVLRIDPKDSVGFIKNPLAIQPILHLRNDELGEKSVFSATILPRAKMTSITHGQTATTLRSFATRGQLDLLGDLKPDQFGWIDGVKYPVLVDISSMSSTPEQKKNKGSMGDVEHYIAMEPHSFSNLYENVPVGDMKANQKAYDINHERVLLELRRHGMDISSPEKGQGLGISPAA